MHLASASDERFFPGLHAALASAVFASSGKLDYTVHVIDGGITDAQWTILETNLRALGALRGIEVELRRIPANHPVFERFPIRRGSNLTYARLAIPYLIDAARVVYMDSDVLCLLGVERFWEALEPQTPLVAVLDPLRRVGRDCTLRDRLPRRMHGQPYFNAGIIGINVALCRANGSLEAIDRLIGEASEFKYVDQTLLNLVFLGAWSRLPDVYNLVLTLENSACIIERPCAANLHYVGSGKPWLSTQSSFYRFAPDTLFDLVSRLLGTNDSREEPRTINPLRLAQVRRKAWIYSLLWPRRGQLYRRALATITTAPQMASMHAAAITSMMGSLGSQSFDFMNARK